MTNPLNDIVPAKARKATYAVIALGALAWTVYSASGGDVKALIGGLIVMLANLTAASNVPAPADPAPGQD